MVKTGFISKCTGVLDQYTEFKKITNLTCLGIFFFPAHSYGVENVSLLLQERFLARCKQRVAASKETFPP